MPGGVVFVTNENEAETAQLLPKEGVENESGVCRSNDAESDSREENQ
jgi:hypothetical protein